MYTSNPKERFGGKTSYPEEFVNSWEIAKSQGQKTVKINASSQGGIFKLEKIFYSP